MIMGYNKNKKSILFIYTNLFKKCKLSNEKKNERKKKWVKGKTY